MLLLIACGFPSDPQSVLHLTASVSATTLGLTWDTPATGSRQDYFTVDLKPVLRDSGAPFTHLNVTRSTLQVPDCFPGEIYHIYVYAVSRGLMSSPMMTNATIRKLNSIIS